MSRLLFFVLRYYWRFWFPLRKVMLRRPRTPASDSDSLTLSNDAISATWTMHGGSLRWQTLTNHFTRSHSAA